VLKSGGIPYSRRECVVRAARETRAPPRDLSAAHWPARHQSAHLTIETERGETITSQEVVELERTGLQPETLGLTLAEAKTICYAREENRARQSVTSGTLLCIY
jgi:hypothetical protein